MQTAEHVTVLGVAESLKREEIKRVMRAMGAIGGANSRKNLTPEQRKELAQRAAAARWGTKRPGKKKIKE